MVWKAVEDGPRPPVSELTQETQRTLLAPIFGGNPAFNAYIVGGGRGAEQYTKETEKEAQINPK